MEPDKVYRVGWILGVAAYCLPLMKGSALFLEQMPAVWSGGGAYRPIVQIGIANLIATGVFGIGFCAAGLRRRIPTFWFLNLFFLVWVVGNDLAAAIRAGRFPLPIVPGAMIIVSLILTSGCLRGRPDPA